MTVTFSLAQALSESRIQGTRSMKHLLNHHEVFRVRKPLFNIDGRSESFLAKNWSGPCIMTMAEAGFYFSDNSKQSCFSWLLVVCIFSTHLGWVLCLNSVCNLFKLHVVVVMIMMAGEKYFHLRMISHH